MIIIRRTEQRDLGKIHMLMNGNLDKYFEPSVINFFFMQWPAGQFFAEDVFGRPAGAVCCSVLTGGRVSISLLAVDANHRRQGVGGRLLDNVRNTCLIQGYTTVQLEVRTTNFNAISFYTKRGFVKSEYLPRYYDDGGDAFRMVCDVRSMGRIVEQRT
ncbi:MAG: GNAT family N-acetyltransferase [Candidatus Methanomethylophilaceae archaeon]|nr:GNAT family N-acetyltransferase [Candidatus Methanomethylophilaceae archaeon]